MTTHEQYLEYYKRIAEFMRRVDDGPMCYDFALNCSLLLSNEEMVLIDREKIQDGQNWTALGEIYQPHLGMSGFNDYIASFNTGDVAAVVHYQDKKSRIPGENDQQAHFFVKTAERNLFAGINNVKEIMGNTQGQGVELFYLVDSAPAQEYYRYHYIVRFPAQEIGQLMQKLWRADLQPSSSEPSCCTVI